MPKAKKSVNKQTIPTDINELKAAIVTAKNEYSDTKRSNAAGELANPLALRAKRRQIARYETALTAARKESK